MLIFYVQLQIIDTPTHVFGDFLKKQVEDRLKFYESGDVPKKNIDVMKEAIEVSYWFQIVLAKNN